MSRTATAIVSTVAVTLVIGVLVVSAASDSRDGKKRPTDRSIYNKNRKVIIPEKFDAHLECKTCTSAFEHLFNEGHELQEYCRESAHNGMSDEEKEAEGKCTRHGEIQVSYMERLVGEVCVHLATNKHPYHNANQQGQYELHLVDLNDQFLQDHHGFSKDEHGEQLHQYCSQHLHELHGADAVVNEVLLTLEMEPKLGMQAAHAIQRHCVNACQGTLEFRKADSLEDADYIMDENNELRPNPDKKERGGGAGEEGAPGGGIHGTEL